MTVVMANDRISPPYDCTGGETLLPYDWRILQAQDLAVHRMRGGVQTILTYAVAYSVTGVGNANGGNVVLTPAALPGDRYVVEGKRPNQRVTDLVDQQTFSAAKLNADYDNLQIQLQEIKRRLDGTLTTNVLTGDLDAGNRRITNVPEGEEPGDLVIYSQLQALIAALGGTPVSDPFDISGLDFLSVEDAVTGEDRVIVHDESEETPKQQTLDQFADSLTYQPGFPGSIRRRMGAKHQAHWDIDELPGESFTDRMTAAIEEINDQQNLSLDLLAQGHTLEALLPVVTGDNWSITGKAPGVTRINVGAGAGNQSNILTFGNNANSCVNFRLANVELGWLNTPDPNVHGLRCVRSTQGLLDNIYWVDAPGLIMLGDDTAAGAGRIVMRHWRGDANKGGASIANILVQRAGACIMRDVFVGSNQNSSAGGAIIAIKPLPANGALSKGFVDTLIIAGCGFQYFANPVVGEPVGARSKPVGLLMDNSEGPVVNIYVRGCYIDHTSEAGIKLYQAPGGVEQLTNIKINGVRLACDAGESFRAECLSTNVTGGKRDVDVTNLHCNTQTNNFGARILGSGYRSCNFSFNSLADSDGTVAKPGYIGLAADGWTLIGNRGRLAGGNLNAVAHGIVVDPAVTETLVALNYFPVLAAGGKAVLHPTYAALSPKRLFDKNLGPNGPEGQPSCTMNSAGTVDLGADAARFVFLDGNAGPIISLGTSAPLDTEKVMICGSTPTFQNGAALVVGSADLTVQAGDVLYLLRVAAGWKLTNHQPMSAFLSAGGIATLTNKGFNLANNTLTGTLAQFNSACTDADFASTADVAGLLAASDAFVPKGPLDCSTNPNYPAADAGHVFRVIVAGKIGGASGPNVESGDILTCWTDGTPSANHATVGSSWSINQTNIDGAVVGPATATDSHFAQFDGPTGKAVKGGLSFDADGTMAANSATRVPAQAAVVTYVAAAVAAGVAAIRDGVTGTLDTLLEIATALAGKLTASNNLSDVGSASVAFANIKQAASETATGVVELATSAETVAGSDTVRATHAAGVKAAIDGAVAAIRDGVTSSFDTLVEIANALAGKLTAASNLSDVANATTARHNLAALGDRVVLVTQSSFISGGVITITGLSQDYKHLIIVMDQVSHDDTGGSRSLRLEASMDGGSSWPLSVLAVAGNISHTVNANGSAQIFNYSASGLTKFMMSCGFGALGASGFDSDGAADTVDAVRVVASAGNIDGGTIYVLGVT